jgi:hypothetical protein
MNSIAYNAQLDQILMSVRNNSEVWIIDHGTTTTEAKGHSGGRRGKGGDLLYRWGNPIAYHSGTTADAKLYQQHDAEWVEQGCPGAGNITVFNNGLSRAYSSVDEFSPPLAADSSYTRVSGSAFGPSSFVWSYVATPPASMYAAAISGAHRLPNGNTIIDDGTHGTFYEVTSNGEVVWKYICPVVATGPLSQGDAIPDDPARVGEKMNAVFRVYKYPLNYAGFAGKVLTPGDYVEKYPTAVTGDVGTGPASYELKQNYPNPFNPTTSIRYSVASLPAGQAGRQSPAASSVRLVVHDLLGREVAVLVNEMQQPGSYEVTFNGSQLPSGVYLYRLQCGEYTECRKMALVK